MRQVLGPDQGDAGTRADQRQQAEQARPASAPAQGMPIDSSAARKQASSADRRPSRVAASGSVSSSPWYWSRAG